MIFDDYFERIVIISLDPAGERARRTLGELRLRNLSASAIAVQAQRGENLQQPTWFKASAGAWGCLNSHLDAIENAHRDGAQSLLVLEDDCTWLPDAAPRAQAFLADVPADWGQIYFGGQLREEFPPQRLEKSACLRASSVHRTHAYAVNRAVMPALLAHARRWEDFEAEAVRPGGKKRHLDHQLEVAHRRGDWAVYIPAYWLAGQRENFSEVRGALEPERWWQWVPEGIERRLPLIVADSPPTAEQMRRLHFGYKLSPQDRTIDVGVEQTDDIAELLDTMVIIAEEAFIHRRLPAIHPWKEKCEWLRQKWPAGVVPLSESGDLEPLCQKAAPPP